MIQNVFKLYDMLFFSVTITQNKYNIHSVMNLFQKTKTQY